jgi:methylated-DNA-[protein]-cysteine S-methyltransferase
LDRLRFAVFESSLGNIFLVSKNDRLIRLDVTKDTCYEIGKRLRYLYPDSVESESAFQKVHRLLDRYLKGDRVDFDVDVDIDDVNDFTRRVLLETMKIPYGEVKSYLSIGKGIGYPRAPRAVGQAVKRNPIPLIIPCHRVIREDGSIGGYSLEGVSKQALLTLEGVKISPDSKVRRSEK